MSSAETEGTVRPPLTETLPLVIDLLMRRRGISRAEATEHLGISQSTWYAHLKDSKWSATQMVDLAELFDVDIATLFATPDELFRSRCVSSFGLVTEDALASV